MYNPFADHHAEPGQAPGDRSTTTASPAPSHTGLFATLTDDLQAAALEFIGTTTFLTLAFGGVQASAAEAGSAGAAVSTGVERILYVALSFGFALLVSAWLFFRVTGGLFNPNVAAALFLAGVIGPVRFVLFCAAQLAGGVAAAALVLALTPGPLAANAVLAPGINPAQGVFIEAFITATLCLAVLMLAAEKHVATPFAPVGIGLTLFICELFSVYYTGGAANTARAFGPAAVTGFPHGSQWVYWVGPGIGSVVAAVFYAFLKHYRYWKLNPGQDEVAAEQSPADPVRVIAQSAGRRLSVARSPEGARGRRASVRAGARSPDVGRGEKGAGPRMVEDVGRPAGRNISGDNAV